MSLTIISYFSKICYDTKIQNPTLRNAAISEVRLVAILVFMMVVTWCSYRSTW